jgi:hypothetical protein
MSGNGQNAAPNGLTVALFRAPEVLWTVIARGFDYGAG